jgi:hypothetical protein
MGTKRTKVEIQKDINKNETLFNNSTVKIAQHFAKYNREKDKEKKSISAAYGELENLREIEAKLKLLRQELINAKE